MDTRLNGDVYIENGGSVSITGDCVVQGELDGPTIEELRTRLTTTENRLATIEARLPPI